MKAFLLALVVLSGSLHAKVSDVVKAPAKFDGQTISVKGKVDRLAARTSKAGKEYTKFDLVDGKDRLAVYMANRLAKPLKDGDPVTVTGKFAKARKIGERTYKDEIDASTRLDRTFGVTR